MVTAKVSTTYMSILAPLQVQERAIMNNVLLWLSHRKCMVEILIGCKYCVRHLNEKILIAGQAVLQMSQISKSCVIASMSC